MTRWIVDGMNVIGSRPNGWWRDRPGAMRALTDELGAGLTVVTSDHALAGRVKAAGASVVGAGEFRTKLDG